MTKPLVFQHGAAAAAFSAVTVTWFLFELVMNIRQRLQARGTSSRDPSIFAVTAGIAGSLVGAELLGRRGPLPWPGGGLWPVVAGLVLIVAGIGLRAWSIITLGRFFQYQIRVQPGHRVVTAGPYRYVRHPSYTGVALALLGIALACGDVLCLIPVAVFGGTGLAVRIRAEERQLADALGAEYRQFAAERKRLIPGLW
ncbi:MAG: isoprenylcysteine carboxylmethyltransferase family protein [Actinobacteria bacterium]|nr:isoprenylcysteine carboxylmethyltransferase family protein [Actinomycetota bacterium]